VHEGGGYDFGDFELPKRSRQRRNEAEQDGWDRLAPSLEEERLEQLGSRYWVDPAASCRQTVMLLHKLNQFAAAAELVCERCGGPAACCFTRATDAAQPSVLVVDTNASLRVTLPLARCAACSWEWGVTSVLLLRLFPATPKQPEVLYTIDILELCDQLVENAHSSVGRLATSLHATHERLDRDSGEGHDLKWRNLAAALRAWRRLRDKLELRSAGMELRLGGRRCAACWRQLRAVSGDCCAGLTHLKASGRSQGGLQPQREGILLPDTLVEEALRDAGKLGQAEAVAEVPCSDMRAAQVLTHRRAHYDVMGLGLLACRHEQVRAPCAGTYKSQHKLHATGSERAACLLCRSP
jgi:hypothetical protein